MRLCSARPLLAAALLACGVTACAEGARPVPGAIGEPAPAYAAPTLQGDTVALADLRGEAVLLNVWATWCAPCRKEMPGLEAVHARYGGEGLHVVGVSIDSRASAGEVRRFLAEYGITFTILHDADERVTRTFRTAGVPETFLIGRDGRVRNRWIGMIDLESESIQAAVRDALADGGGRAS